MLKKEIVFYDNICYSKKLKMRSYLKYCATCVSAVVGISAFVAGITLGIIHFKNSTGRGGFDSPVASNLASDIINQVEEENAEASEEDAIAAFEKQEMGDVPSFNNHELTYISYRVKKGDMIGYIAEEFGITQDTIISVNNIHSSRTIQIGSYLKIPSLPGILYSVHEDGETVESIAKKYSVDASQCSLVNNIPLSEELKAGKSLFVPNAELDWVTRQEINGDLFIKPIKARFRFSSRYGWRENPFDASKRSFHTGIDLACPTGTSIYAALPGKVVSASWSDVYGYHVIVAHHSGYKTLYGHMSKIIAKKGQYVDTNSILGKVGSTGWSTGPHLHFTVYKNGRTVNPANLWK